MVKGTCAPLFSPLPDISTLFKIARSGRVSVVRMKHKKTTNLTCFMASIKIVDRCCQLPIAENNMSK